MCKKIHRGGNAEQYHADKKYKEAVAVAVEACAEDTKGQTCYICTQALHWKTKEGLVRMCACRGTAGFVHVSCLAEQAKILFAEAEENNLDWEAKIQRFERWFACGLCEQEYHGVVACALGWACWKTYVGRPETERARQFAMTQLGNGLGNANHHEEELSVREAELSLARRLGASESHMLVMQGNLAVTYFKLGRVEQALRIERDVYSGRLKLNGEQSHEALVAASNYTGTLLDLERFKEAKSLLRSTVPVARRVLGENHDLTLSLRLMYAQSLFWNDDATLDDLREAVTTLDYVAVSHKRLLGDSHPEAARAQHALENARRKLARARTSK